jgi:hypothetical protein
MRVFHQWRSFPLGRPLTLMCFLHARTRWTATVTQFRGAPPSLS